MPLFTSQSGGSWAQEDVLGPMSPKNPAQLGWLELLLSGLSLLCHRLWRKAVIWCDEGRDEGRRKANSSIHLVFFSQRFHRMIYQRFKNHHFPKLHSGKPNTAIKNPPYFSIEHLILYILKAHVGETPSRYVAGWHNRQPRSTPLNR